MKRSHDLNPIFDRCLERLQAGQSLEAVLADYPQWADELRPVLEAVLAIWAARGSDTVPVAAMQRSRMHLNEEIQRRNAVEKPLNLWQRWLQSMRRSTAPALMLVAAVLAVVALTGLASVQALPGEALYPVKIAAERFTLSLPADASERLTREETYDSRRFAEVEELRQQQREQEVDFTGYLELGEDGVWRVGKIPINVPENMLEALAELEGQYIFVHADLMPDSSLVLEWFEARLYTISGRVTQIDGARIRVDTLWVDVSPEVAAAGLPVVGQQVTVSVVRLQGGGVLAVKLSLGSVPDAPQVVTAPTEKPNEQEGSGASDQEQASPTAEGKQHEDDKDRRDSDKDRRPTKTPTAGPVEPTPQPTRSGDGDEKHKTPEATKQPEPTRTPDD